MSELLSRSAATHRGIQGFWSRLHCPVVNSGWLLGMGKGALQARGGGGDPTLPLLLLYVTRLLSRDPLERRNTQQG